MRSGPGSSARAIRRRATVLAAVGALLASSGIALMATSAPADAGSEIHKSYVCKYVGTPGDAEVLQTGQNPIWVDNHSLDPTADLVKKGDTFTDAQGFSVVIVANTPRLHPEPGIEACTTDEPGDHLAVAVVSFADPTCDQPAEGSYSAEGSEHAGFVVEGTTNTGDTITITATAVGIFEFATGARTSWEHTFTAPTGCTIVEPPDTEDTPGTTVEPPAQVTTPTVVEAGLAGAGTSGWSNQQGAVLAAAGLLLMAAAGGLARSAKPDPATKTRAV